MNYGFYTAQVVESATVDDNRLRVRILPQMKDVDSSLCPVYPSFFRDSLYTGKVGDLVWVICDDEFSMGYVFGRANYNTYPDRTVMDGESSYRKGPNGEILSIPSDLRDSINRSVSELEMKYLDMGNAKVTYWDKDCMHYIDRNTGSKVIAFRNGSFYIMGPDRFVMKVGGSVIKIESGTVSISAEGSGEGKGIKLQSGYVGLGMNPSNNVMINDVDSGNSAMLSEYVFA